MVVLWSILIVGELYFMAQKQKRKWIIGVVVVIFVVAAVTAFLIWNNNFREKKDDRIYIDSLQEDRKKESDNKKEDEDEPEDEKKVKQYEGEDPNKGESLTGAVTYAGVEGDNLVIRVNIDQYLYDGKCLLGLFKGDEKIYSAEAGITTAATTATCEGFNVPVSELGNGGFETVIDLNSGEKAGIINGKVEI